MDRPTLYEFAGGAHALARFATAFHARCLADPVLEHPFSHGTDPNHTTHLAEYWGEVLGGTPVYSQRRGSHRSVLAIHAHQGMEDDLASRFVAAFDGAMDDVGMPADAEFRRAMGDYIRWATDEVMQYSPMDAVLPAEAPMPRWDWNGLVDG